MISTLLRQNRPAVAIAVFVILGTGTLFVGSAIAQPADVDTADLAGSGTDADPYIITSASELQAVQDDPDAHYELGNDIDASGTAEWNGGSGFAPIEAFSGHFDGNQHTISGLSIDRSATDNVGLFGDVDEATIENVHIANSDISGKYSVGIVAGTNSEESVIRNVSTTGTVVGADNVGGLIGYNIDSSVVTQSSSSATVSVSIAEREIARAGGLVGGNYRSAIINQSYATGDVDGVGRAGGFLGENFNNSRVANSYATGSVNGSQSGGLVGGNFRGSTVTGSYWDTEASGLSTSDGDATGLTTAEMTGEAARTNMAEFDFDTTWQIATDPAAYPTLVMASQNTNHGDGSDDNQSDDGSAVENDGVSINGSEIRIPVDGRTSLAVTDLPSDVTVSPDDNGIYDSGAGEILYGGPTAQLPETVTFTLTPGESYEVGDTIQFTVDGENVSLPVTEAPTVPTQLADEGVSATSYNAVVGSNEQLGAGNLAAAIQSWAGDDGSEQGFIGETNVGAGELSSMINYWATEVAN